MKKVLNLLGSVGIAALAGLIFAQLPSDAQVPKNFSLENNGQLQKLVSSFITGPTSGTITIGGSPANVICSGCSAATSVGVTINQSPANVLTTPTVSPQNVTVGNATTLGQSVMAGSSPVALASNQSVGDPCTFQAKATSAFGVTNATTTVIVGNVSGKKLFVCSLVLISGQAASVSLTEGTATCGAGNSALIGSTTAANGMVLAANGGLTLGGGIGTVAQTQVTTSAICLLTSAVVSAAGNVTYVAQ